MPHSPSAFGQLLEPLDRRLVARAVAAHAGNRGVGDGDGAWTCERHLKAMLFAQVAGLTSLRQIEQALAARPAALYHLDLRAAPHATLSDAARRRPAAVFRDIAIPLMARLARQLRREGDALIRLIDASPIPLRDGRFAWAEADARCRGLKLHLAYDPRAVHPVRFAVTSPKVPDLAEARTLPLEPGATYVFDKGYADYAWWQDIVDAGAVFVTRLKDNAYRRDVRERPVPKTPETADILADRALYIGRRQPRGGSVNRLYDTELREVVVARDGAHQNQAPLRLLTNDHKRSPREIADLYKERWRIELFFKWIKQNLNLRTFLGRSENAVRIQLYIALIAFCLLRLLHGALPPSPARSQTALLARLKVALFDPIDLTNRSPPRPRPPQCRKPTPQLAFRLAKPA